MKQESIEEIAERIANEYIENGFMLKTRRARCKAAIVKALRNERERGCRLLCEFCSNDEYNLIWHHEEWRHYRKTDMYVEYCKAEILRGRPSGKEGEVNAE